jgi:hypothetical protein
MRNDKWFKLFVLAIGVVITIASAAAGYVLGNLNDNIVAVEQKLETHQLSQFASELVIAERFKEIEVNQKNQLKVLEEIRDELREAR